MALITFRSTLMLVMVGAILLTLVACGDEPAPATSTDTPQPTATPQPAATPQPTATPSMGLLEGIDETTVGRTVIASFSEAEVSCIRAELGDEAFQAFLDRPVLAEDTTFPFNCLTGETAANLNIAMLSTQIGRLSPESESCLRAFYGENGFLPLSAGGDATDFGYVLKLQLCLTDEEAQALSGPGDDQAFLPLLTCDVWRRTQT